MSFAEAIREGFSLVHRNWQLVVIQALMAAVAVAGLLVLVGLPIGMAFVMLGMDISDLAAMRHLVADPEALFSRYLAVALAVVAGAVAYLLFMLFLWLYVVGGSAGTIGLALKDPSRRFSLRGFCSEGGRLFLRLLGYAALMLLASIGAFMLLALLNGVLAGAASAAGYGTFTGRFLRVFASLVTFTAAAATGFGLSSVALTGLAPLFEGAGPLDALNRAAEYIKQRPSVLVLYLVLFSGYMMASLVLMAPGYALGGRGIEGMLFYLLWQFVANIVEGYLCLVILASAFAGYFDGASAASGGSTPESGTSGQAGWQGPPPDPQGGTL